MGKKYICLDDLMQFPIRKDNYDKKHGNEHFIYGIESVIEYAESMPVIELTQDEQGRCNMSEIKLEACPFCGHEAIFDIKDGCSYAASGVTRAWEFGVRCPACNVSLPKTTYRLAVQVSKHGEIDIIKDDRQEAADAWNKRADDGKKD